MKERVLVYESISGGGMEAIAAEHPALLAQGVAMRDALIADLARVDGLAVSCVVGPHAPLTECIAGVEAIDADPDSSPAALLRRLAPGFRHVWVIAPESGGLLGLLATEVGPERWVGCRTAAIGVAASKSATRARLAAHGVPVPAAWQPGAPDPNPGASWVVKPDDGAGAEDTVLHADFADARADLQARLGRGVASTMERWVDGAALSMSLLCGPDGVELLSINHQHIDVRPGAPASYRGVAICAEPVESRGGRVMAGLAQEIAEAVPGLRGYIGVDLVWNPNRGPVVIEINPRLTCAYVGLSAALGRNLGNEILQRIRVEATANVL